MEVTLAVDVLRTLSLAVLTAGLLVFGIIAFRLGLLRQWPYSVALGTGVAAWLIRATVSVDSFTELPDNYFLVALPLWFGWYGVTFMLTAKGLAETKRNRARAIEQVVTEKLRQGFEQ